MTLLTTIRSRVAAAWRRLHHSEAQAADLLLSVGEAPPRGMVPCLDHAGRKCIHCTKDEHGHPSGYLPAPVSAVGWTDRAHQMRMAANQATSIERRAHLFELAAIAWGEALHMTPPVARSHILDQTVRDWIEAGNPNEAAAAVEEFAPYASEWACVQVQDVRPNAEGHGVGIVVKLRQEALEEREEMRRKAAHPWLVEVQE